MEDSSRWLSATMILWLPVIYLTTYLGFFEAYELAKSNELFSLDYPENYPVFLILPAMIPTMFTAYTVINRKRMMFNLITKFNTFHEQVDYGNPIRDSIFLTDSEFQKLPLEDKLEYCYDLNRVSELVLSAKLRRQIYSEYKDSKNPRFRAIANLSMSGVQTKEVNFKSEFEYSKIAYEAIKDQHKDELYFQILNSYIVDSVVLGYEKSLELVEQIDSELGLEYEYWKLRLHLRKIHLNFMMNPNLIIDFKQLESRMDFHKYTLEQSKGLESTYGKIKKEILLKQNRLDEFETLILNRNYFRKWSGKINLLDGGRNDLARLYRKQGRFDEALELFKLSLSDNIRIKDRTSECVAMINIGKTYFGMGEYEKSLEISRDTSHLAKSLEFPRAQIESLTIEVKSLEKLGLENQEQKSELEELINLHGIEADPD